jgi:hypothetical protein
VSHQRKVGESLFPELLTSFLNFAVLIKGTPGYLKLISLLRYFPYFENINGGL